MVFAFLYLSHGLTWLFKAFGGRPVPLTTRLITAGVIECICGTLILMGLFTSWAAFIACGEMAVAYFIAHVPRGHFWPIQNGGEITVALCFGFLFIATFGSGPISVEALLGSGRRKG
jgi:putative oxidoreductase